VNKSITPIELHHKLMQKENLLLIDVREAFEHDEFNIGGTLIPLSEITKHINNISTDKEVIFYCKKGIRSNIAIQRLQEKFPFKNLVNLKGGIDAWKKEIVL
jgi:adenylyltransferase/sulfurtransferase